MFEIKYDRDGSPLKLDQQRIVEPEPKGEEVKDESVAQEAVEQVVEYTAVAPEPVEQPQPVPEKKTGPSESFKELREAKNKAQRERDQAVRLLEEMQARQETAKQLQQQAPETDDELNIAPDEIAEGKHLSKLTKKIQNLEKQLQNYHHQSAEVTAETRLKSQYPDFDKVVSKENIEQLRSEYPELAHTLNSSTDLYTKAVSAYTLIKKFGIHQEDNFAQEREMAQKNAAKPRPLTSISPQQGDTPLSRANAFANGLTDELKAQLRKEMEEARKNR